MADFQTKVVLSPGVGPPAAEKAVLRKRDDVPWQPTLFGGLEGQKRALFEAKASAAAAEKGKLD